MTLTNWYHLFCRDAVFADGMIPDVQSYLMKDFWTIIRLWQYMLRGASSSKIGHLESSHQQRLHPYKTNGIN